MLPLKLLSGHQQISCIGPISKFPKIYLGLPFVAHGTKRSMYFYSSWELLPVNQIYIHRWCTLTMCKMYQCIFSCSDIKMHQRNLDFCQFRAGLAAHIFHVWASQSNHLNFVFIRKLTVKSNEITTYKLKRKINNLLRDI